MLFGSYAISLPTYTELFCHCDNSWFDIKRTDSFKCLGIIIDLNMKWKEHIDYVVNKIRPVIPNLKYFEHILLNAT